MITVKGERLPEKQPLPSSSPSVPSPKGTVATKVPPVGFRAELNGASLWDLVQMECMARSRRVVQVTGEGGVGYLYFASGRVVHAVTPRLSGTAAALEILNWTNGAFQPCERGWPTVTTIDTSYESLILRAAKRRDEAAASNLLEFRGRAEVGAQDGVGRESESIEQMQIEEVAMPEMRMPNNNQPAEAVPFKRDDTLPDFAVMIRVAPNGAIIKNKGGTDELAGVVAYTHRLVQLVGELLGLDRFVAMECTFEEKEGAGGGVSGTSPRCLLFGEANGDTVALRPRPESNIQPLRESLGL